MSISLEGRVAVVTGSGRGIGRAHVLEFARRGAAVLVNDVSREHADATVDEIKAAGGKAAVSYDTVATPEGGAAIIDRAAAAFGKLDILVHNAGQIRPAYFEDLTLADLDAILDTHLRGAFFVGQPAWRLMKGAGYGRIVMTSSASGMYSHQAMSNYASAKAGLYGLTKALAYEGQRYGVKTNCILPWAATTIGQNNPIPDMLKVWRLFVSEAMDAKLAGRNTPDSIAYLAAYLVSEGCEPNGEAFSVSGGRYARTFVGVGDGWTASMDGLSADEVAAHMDQIRDISKHSVPMWAFEEAAGVARRL
ncbi:MAG: SDR family NAD(P)-dependent oxidoreductase [Caulobacteraceae bacterium]|nr:SDR family NAD(P)-dependent oxidoreductase [Caulobacteraceae bacterium]